MLVFVWATKLHQRNIININYRRDNYNGAIKTAQLHRAEGKRADLEQRNCTGGITMALATVEIIWSRLVHRLLTASWHCVCRPPATIFFDAIQFFGAIKFFWVGNNLNTYE